MRTNQSPETNMHIIVFCSCHTKGWKAGGGEEARRGPRECDAMDARDKNRSGEAPSIEPRYTRMYMLVHLYSAPCDDGLPDSSWSFAKASVVQVPKCSLLVQSIKSRLPLHTSRHLHHDHHPQIGRGSGFISWIPAVSMFHIVTSSTTFYSRVLCPCPAHPSRTRPLDAVL